MIPIIVCFPVVSRKSDRRKDKTGRSKDQYGKREAKEETKLEKGQGNYI